MPQILKLVLAVVCVAVVCVGGIAAFIATGLSRPVATIERARSAFDSGDLVNATDLATRVDATSFSGRQLDELALLRGDIFLASGRNDEALAAYEAVSSSDGSLFASASMARGKLYRDQGAYARAIAEFEQLAERNASNIEPRRELIQTLLLGGVRHRAWPHIRELLTGGSYDLSVVAAAATPRYTSMIPFAVRKQISQGDPFLLIGTIKLHLRQGLHAKAGEFLTQLQALNRLPVETWILDGWLRYDRDGRAALANWLADCPFDEVASEWHPEYWYLRGLIAIDADDHAGATRCFFETLQRWPDYLPAVAGLAKSAARSNHPEIAKAATERAKLLDELVAAASFIESGEIDDHFEVAARSTLALGRVREAAAWCRLAKTMNRGVQMHWLSDVASAVESRVQTSQRWVEQDQLLTDRFPWQEFSLPRQVAVAASDSSDDQRHVLRFRNDAELVGIDFRGRYEPATTHFMRFFTGSGVGVIDYDLDRAPDLFFTQNSEVPVGPDSDLPPAMSQLFRNQRGRAFQKVTMQSRSSARGFGQGVAVGDVDGDGFPDLYIGNVGQNELLLNNGDGTFREATSQVATPTQQHWTTSVVVADLDADGFADLFDANYLGGDDVATRVCGLPERPRSCSPRSFPPSPDSVCWGTGDAELLFTRQDLDEVVPGNGLGVAVGNFSQAGQLDVFVANDLTANHLFVRPDKATRRFEDVATFRGLAYDSEGASQACMGIACSDVNKDGRTDLYVSNFYAERNALYASEPDGFFSDLVDEYQAGGDTYKLLGFGTQFLDADLDGDDDLIVTNGHIWDARDGRTPYEMPPRLYERVGARFHTDNENGAGRYFRGKYLGRALARLDWNLDGRDDVVITDLRKPAALLTNTSPFQRDPLQIKLIATASHRDAIGAVITVTTNTSEQMRALTAGDGYMASNERILTFAVPNESSEPMVTVAWPSGRTEEWMLKQPEKRVVLVEGGGRSGVESFANLE